ncbi:tRNA-specific 2-thiouridylase [Acetitomaculum ruminis DSM 5522]|uniref:tRNA-specific 2-thiouridylase MnmA n=1 Tax=Acetitomaculum ruminis DSM 5522 TaxID=1120918 RepID=A0A1I0W7G0_9FIRM|nr:tRNA 2-thiouridine(34) synthase MnmA [Acetitomaculum ruminis]SFA84257.1 tRNA-specific 2-thiouridylase [Acetitomaculum ruminis DSM 5522]
MEKKKVVVGMSGGVDSSVAAYLLKEEGYDVVGVTMQIWQDEDECTLEKQGGCCGLSAVEDARRVARVIGIPYYVMNFKKEFKENVIDYFIDEYKRGRTPNPCIACNRYVKWEALLQRALEIGADYIATGHYAKICKSDSGRLTVKTSVTSKKDQSYALYNLTQFQLEHTLMPVGDYSKDEIREIAQKVGIPVANKPDSQEICFVSDDDYAGYIERETGEKFKEGDFVDEEGNVIGRHKGIIHYTIGQRKGLNLAMGHPVFVNKLDVEKNQVVIGDSQSVFKDILYADNVNYMAWDKFNEPKRLYGKIRYSAKPMPCTVTPMEDGRLKALFDEPQRAITPGQAVVFYNDNNEIVCGGTIC